MSSVVGLAMAVSAFAASKTLYVDVNSTAANPDGLSRATAYSTIQAAVDAASVDDTVSVYPGEYKVGSKAGSEYDASKGSADQARVVISKRMTLVSVEGRDKTLIVGAKAFASNKLTESGTVRCVEVTPNAVKSVISGFTLASGGSCATGGAGIKCPDDKRVYICDCAITNCLSRQRGGASQWGYFTGCLYADNGSENAGGCAMRGYFRNCVFYRNRNEGFYYPGEFNCCAFIRNSGQVLSSHNANCYVYNSVFLNNDTDKLGGAVYHLVNCVSDRTEASFKNNGTAYESCQFEASEYQFLAPAFDDWRALFGSKVATAGDAANLSHLSYESIPNRDYAGNLITATSGTCCAGPVQTVATARSGSIWFDGIYEYQGVARPHKDYAFCENYPTQHFVRAVCAPGQEVFRYGVSANCGLTRYAQMDGWLCVMPPSDTTANMNLAPVFATDILKVDPTGKGGAYTTLQAAVDAASASSGSYTVIRAAEGTYDAGGAVCHGLSNRVAIVDKNVKIVGAGAGKSFIVGADDPTTENAYGLGPNAVRCAALSGANYCEVIQGFTLTGGRTNAGLNDAAGRAGGVSAHEKESNNPSFVLDSVISNCTGYAEAYGAAVHCGNYQRVRIVCNRSVSGGITDRCQLYSSLVAENTSPTQNEHKYAQLNYLTCTYFCTAVGSANMLLRRYQSYCYDSIFSQSFELSGSQSSATEFWGNLLWGTTYRSDATGVTYVTGDPKFVRASAGDYRIFTDSAAIGAGDNADWIANMWKYATSDLGNGRLAFSASGKPTCGAYQTPQKIVSLSVSASRGGGVEIVGGPVDTSRLAVGETLTLTAVETNRLFKGFVVNGQALPSSQKTYVHTVTGNESAGFSIVATYSDAWYVNADPLVGNDANDGCTPQTPKHTLKAILTVPGLLPDETVHAAAGTYDEGEMLHGKAVDGNREVTTRSRACVPAGVTLLADEGPEKTVIVGAAATVDPDEYGLGTNAVRCVYLASGAKVRGFTLTGGHTHDARAEGGDNLEGAGVLGSGYNASVVEACVISNNVAYAAGAGTLCHLVNCRVFGNRATWRRAVGHNIKLTGCVIDGNVGAVPIQYAYGIDACTIGANHAAPVISSSNGLVMRNTLVLAADKDTLSSSLVAVHSAFVAGSGVASENLTDCVVTNAAALAVSDDGLYTPVIGLNAAVDKGDVALLDDESDLYGNPRVANGTMDIGAVEAPWLARYSKDLGARVAVTNASPTVVEGAGRTVNLPVGARVDLVWRGRGTGNELTYEMPISVTGAGTLTVFLNGEVLAEVGAADSPRTVRFSSDAVANGLSFVHTPGSGDSGIASLGRFHVDTGFSLLIR